ncbi:MULTISPECIES: UvrD-helicase domain-containing protein [unclassified Croceitalea]|uniref:UvrD-helicase domain-containing protein n=1 Tax=unclassified Croceitalea TaxID=2632280 RepID=UPI0030D72900
MRRKHLSVNTIKIYNASAGSGKTYQLTKAYLKLILAPYSKQKYRELLAITFTNKAVAEMKQRILESLHAFSKEKLEKDKTPLFNDILEELHLTPSKLRIISKQVLKELLHNYAFFEISTIDKFTHKIIRTFARDLKISQGFDVVLDTDVLLEEAVGRLLNRAGEEDSLTNVLLDFSLEKIDDDKSWNIAYDLFEIGKLLFQENHNSHIKAISSKSIKDFVRLQKTLKATIKRNEDSIKAAAEHTLELIHSHGLEFTDFTRSSFPKFMQGIADDGFNIDFTANWKQNFGSNKLYNKNCPEPIKAKLDELHPKFLILFNTVKDNFHSLSFLKNCYKNIVPLTVLNEIAKEVSKLQRENDVLPISEFNSIISKEIKNQPIPFIYERLGEKYRHYFIDEFQDTSLMQWENLIPLISNAIESENEKGEKGSLLLVGDAKQAIYRWRGGRAEQFLNLLNLHTNPFAIAPHIENLDTNWRSKKEIVDFNNTFFSFAAKKLNNPTYRNLFEIGNKQKANKENGGYVELIFTEKELDDTDYQYCVKTFEVLKRALDAGYRLLDICVLVRDNKKGAILADFLTEKKIPIISPDSLLLANNNEVLFLVSLLRFIDNPENKEAGYSILDYLFKEEKGHHDFIREHLTSVDALLDKEYGFIIDSLKRRPTYDILEQAISSFKLTGHSDAHLSHFIDEVFDFSQKEDSSIFSFLKFWFHKKEKLSVKAPESLNAVQVMTVHKSKGLEFPVVIFPYANSKIVDPRSKKLWLSVEQETFDGFDELLINSNKELTNYNKITEEVYNNELDKLELDAYNVLYVALTRAQKALFIISNEGNNKGTYGELFIDYLKDINLWEASRLSYCFGDFLLNEVQIETAELQENIPYICSQKSNTNFKIVTKAEMLWDLERQEAIQKGNLIHKALSRVDYQNDIEEAIISFKNNGDIKATDVPLIEKKLKQVVFHPHLNPYYQEGLIIYNEKELLNPNGTLLRPDRLVIKDNSVTIIDYKTGSKSQIHINQLQEYASVLEKMNYVVKDMILVYINETVNPIFI